MGVTINAALLEKAAIRTWSRSNKMASMGKTRLTINKYAYFRVSILENIIIKVRFLISRFAYAMASKIQQSKSVGKYLAYGKAVVNKDKGPLTEAEANYLDKKGSVTLIKRPGHITSRGLVDSDTVYSAENNLEKWWVCCASLGAMLIKGDPDSIKSSANLGALFDDTLCFLAGEFPNVNFTSVDFATNLAEINASLSQRPNWNFLSGYPLELLKKNATNPDLAFFLGASLLFRNAELREYFNQLREKAKYVVIGEPWFPDTTSKRLLNTTMPDEIDASDSRPVFGGLYLHNYPEIFEACGFEPLLSLVVGNQNNSTFYTYYSVAVNREHTLPEKLKSQLQSWPKE